MMIRTIAVCIAVGALALLVPVAAADEVSDALDGLPPPPPPPQPPPVSVPSTPVIPGPNIIRV